MKARRKIRLLTMTLLLAFMVGTLISATTLSSAAKASSAVKVKQTFVKGKYRYKVTSLKGKTGTAALIGTKSKNISAIKVPETVTNGKYKLTVTEIGSKAFKNLKKLKSVTTNTKLVKIGRNAFSGCKKLAEVNITSTNLRTVGKNAFKGVSKNIVINIPTEDKANDGTPEIEAKVAETEKRVTETEVKVAETEKKVPETEAKVAETEKKVTETEVKVAETEKKAPETEAKVTETEKKASDEEKVKEEVRTSQTETTRKEPEATEERQTEDKAEIPETDVKVPETETEAQVLAPEVPETETEVSKTKDAETETNTPETEPEVKVPETEAQTPETEAQAPETEVKVPETEAQVPETEAPQVPETEAKTKPHKHSYTNWKSTIKATCTEAGLETATCSCGMTKTHTIPALGHQYDVNYTVDVQPTCITIGTKSKHCVREGCAAVTDSRTIPETEHVYGEWRTLREASCVAGKSMMRTCTVCGDKQIKNGQPLEHQLVHTHDVQPTCTQRGQKYSECTVCHQVFFSYFGQALGHEYTKVTEEATCTKDGQEYEVCTREGCGSKINVQVFKATGHNWEQIDEKKATCTEIGTRTMQCANCHEQKVQITQAMLGHNYSAYVDNDDATCAHPGTETSTCTICGATRIRPSGKTVAHTMVHHPEVPATCGKSGIEAYDQCSVCGYRKSIPASIPPASDSHEWVEKSTTVSEAPCMIHLSYRECERCGLRENISFVPGNGHQWNEETGKCDICGYSKPGWTNEIGDKYYDGLRPGAEWHDHYTPETDYDNPNDPAWFKFLEEQGYPARIVWAVGFMIDMSECTGMENNKDISYETMIDVTYKVEKKAPAAPEGCRFAGWQIWEDGEWIDIPQEYFNDADLVLSEDGYTLSAGFKYMDRGFRAHYVDAE